MSKQDKIKDYDSEPVLYCANCYSLKILHEDSIDMDYCGECGCSNFKEASAEEWSELFERRYGHKFIEDSKNVKRSPIFLMSIDKLKSKVYKDSSWKELCTSLYPTFPGGLSRADSVILLFAKLSQDNRLDDLRMKLINQDYKE